MEWNESPLFINCQGQKKLFDHHFAIAQSEHPYTTIDMESSTGNEYNHEKCFWFVSESNVLTIVFLNVKQLYVDGKRIADVVLLNATHQAYKQATGKDKQEANRQKQLAENKLKKELAVQAKVKAIQDFALPVYSGGGVNFHEDVLE